METKTYTSKDKILKISLNDDNESPRAWDNLGKCIFVGKHKHLGDNHNITLNGFSSRQDFIETGEKQLRKQIKDIVVCLPVHLYDHSGISLSTSMGYPFNCRWDSGTCGFIIVTKEAIRKGWDIKRVTKKHIEDAERQAEGEIETLNTYVNGDIYQFEVTDLEGNHLDSCGGFYGSDFKTNGILDDIDEELKLLVLAD